MKLAQYLKAESITLEKFAAEVGAGNTATVQKWATGKRVPRPQFMTAILRATGGKVQPNDFFDIEGI